MGGETGVGGGVRGGGTVGRCAALVSGFPGSTIAILFEVDLQGSVCGDRGGRR